MAGARSRRLRLLEGLRRTLNEVLTNRVSKAATSKGQAPPPDNTNAIYVAAVREAPELLANGATQVLLGDREGPLARFELRDELRDDADLAIRRLRELGLEVEILSGDAAPAVERVAGQLGIAHARSGMRPDDKLARVRELQAEGRMVAMAGDGVNDAPVLRAIWNSIGVVLRNFWPTLWLFVLMMIASVAAGALAAPKCTRLSAATDAKPVPEMTTFVPTVAAGGLTAAIARGLKRFNVFMDSVLR